MEVTKRNHKKGKEKKKKKTSSGNLTSIIYDKFILEIWYQDSTVLVEIT